MQSTSLPSQSQVESFSAPDFNLNRTVEEILAQDFGAVPADEKDLLGTIPYFDQTFDITLDVYEGLISVKDHTPSIPRDRIPLRTAHDIRQFSRNSRMRCFKWLKTLRQEFLFNRVFGRDAAEREAFRQISSP